MGSGCPTPLCVAYVDRFVAGGPSRRGSKQALSKDGSRKMMKDDINNLAILDWYSFLGVSLCIAVMLKLTLAHINYLG